MFGVSDEHDGIVRRLLTVDEHLVWQRLQRSASFRSSAPPHGGFSTLSPQDQSRLVITRQSEEQCRRSAGPFVQLLEAHKKLLQANDAAPLLLESLGSGWMFPCHYEDPSLKATSGGGDDVCENRTTAPSIELLEHRGAMVFYVSLAKFHLPSEDTLIRGLTFMFEWAMQTFPNLARYGMCFLMDMRSTGSSSFFHRVQSVSHFAQVTARFLNRYPVRIRKVFVLDCPVLLKPGLRAAMSLLTSDLRDVIQLLSWDELPNELRGGGRAAVDRLLHDDGDVFVQWWQHFAVAFIHRHSKEEKVEVGEEEPQQQDVSGTVWASPLPSRPQADNLVGHTNQDVRLAVRSPDVIAMQERKSNPMNTCGRTSQSLERHREAVSILQTYVNEQEAALRIEIHEQLEREWVRLLSSVKQELAAMDVLLQIRREVLRDRAMTLSSDEHNSREGIVAVERESRSFARVAFSRRLVELRDALVRKWGTREAELREDIGASEAENFERLLLLHDMMAKDAQVAEAQRTHFERILNAANEALCREESTSGHPPVVNATQSQFAPVVCEPTWVDATTDDVSQEDSRAEQRLLAEYGIGTGSHRREQKQDSSEGWSQANCDAVIATSNQRTLPSGLAALYASLRTDKQAHLRSAHNEVLAKMWVSQPPVIASHTTRNSKLIAITAEQQVHPVVEVAVRSEPFSSALHTKALQRVVVEEF